MEKIISQIVKERKRQTKIWGEQNHDIPVWCTILGEEVGEVNKAAWELYFSSIIGKQPKVNKISELRTELIQVAAVSIQIIEYIDRNIKSKK